MGLVCDWAHPPYWYLDQLIQYMKINTIRLPFSYELVKYNSLGYLDSMMNECKKRGLKVILDWHRTWTSHQGPYPEEGITRDEFLDTWIFLLNRYPETYGVGVFNEIQGGDYDYAINLHKDTILSIENAFPNKYRYFCGCVKWGGDCSRIDLSDIADSIWNRTYIEVHKYIFSGPSNLADWEVSMPYHIPPERWFVGEVGWKNDILEERRWAENFLTYLNFRNISNLCAWTIAHSGDTEGWWKDDCENFQWDKASMLNSYWDKGLKKLRDLDTSSPELRYLT